jgi:Protein of unknown function (DUF3352)
MFKLPSVLLVMATLAIAGCGGGGGGDDEASSPLDEALRYLPADAPFAVAIDTDTDGDQFKAAGKIADRFGAREDLIDQIEDSIDAKPGEIERFEKALGNEFVVGSTDARAFVTQSGDDDQSFVGAIQASDKGSIDALLKDEGAKQDGESNGAKLYKDDDGDTFAIDDDVLVVADTKPRLVEALETRDGDDHLTEEDFDEGTDGVPSDALIRVYVDIESLLRSDPDTKQALKSKWVHALRTGGIALSVEEDQVSIDFDIATDPDGLTDEDLPIGAGSDAPEVLQRDGEINLALRDPRQILQFIGATAKQVAGSDEISGGLDQVETAFDVDIEKDLLGQMEDGIAVSVDLGGKFAARGELKDPKAFERTLAKVAKVLPKFAEGATGAKVGFVEPKAGEDFYALATPSGEQIVFGVVDGVFVLSNDPKVAGTLASEGTQAIPGAKGSIVLGTDAEQLAREILGQADGIGIVDRVKGAIGTRPLDQLTGSIESSTDGLSGSFELTLD